MVRVARKILSVWYEVEKTAAAPRVNPGAAAYI